MTLSLLETAIDFKPIFLLIGQVFPARFAAFSLMHRPQE